MIRRGEAVRKVLGVAVFVSAACLSLCTQAQAFLYWANGATNSIARANLDATKPDTGFIKGAQTPSGVAVDTNYVYWTNYGSGSIGRASIDGSHVQQNFITGASNPSAVAVSGRYIYWANEGSNTIGRSNLDGTGVNERFITGAAVPVGIAVRGSHIYWADDDYPKSLAIERANISGGSVKANFIPNAGAVELAVDASHIYWADFQAQTIGRASLNGTGVDEGFVHTTSSPSGVAVDAQHVYWTDTPENSIGRASLSGAAPDQKFVTDARRPTGIAADARTVTAQGVSRSFYLGRPTPATVATFQDSDLSTNSSDYRATINWGDSTGVQAGDVYPETEPGLPGHPPRVIPGSFGVSGSHTFAHYGTDTVTVAITKTAGEDAGQSTTVEGTVVVVTGYRVEIKSWIPQPEVVDPELPGDRLPVFVAPYEPVCHVPDNPVLKGLYLFDTDITSRFNGNDHRAYDGAFKVFMPIEFDYNGSRIINYGIAPGVHVGTTHRLIEQYSPDGHYSCQELKTATDTVGQDNTFSSGRSFSAEYSISEPLTTPADLSPIFIHVQGTVNSDGSLSVSIRHTLFPSHGVRVFIDGQQIYTHVFSDASCLSPGDVLGVSGAARLASGLLSRETTSLLIRPTPVGTVGPTPSDLCSGSYTILHPFGNPPPIIAAAPGGRPTQAAEAHLAGRSLTVAQAERDRLATVIPWGGAGEHALVIDNSAGRAIVVSGQRIAFGVSTIGVAGSSHTREYGPISGRVVISAAGSAAPVVSDHGRRVHSRRLDRSPPKTTLIGRHRRGKRIVLRFRVRDKSGVKLTYVVVGHRHELVHDGRISLRIKRKTVVAFYSIDIFGNVERPHRLTLKPRR